MGQADEIRVIIVDDSAVMRAFWTKVLDQDSGLRVVATAPDGAVALSLLAGTEADVVILDLEMPEMDGITALPMILKTRPGIRVIVASVLTYQGSKAAVDALALGASDYVAKPSAISGNMQEVVSEMLRKIRALRRDQPLSRTIEDRGRSSGVAHASPPEAIAIGCSTGGPNALVQLLKDLPVSLGVPIFIVQHMPPLFISLLAERLTKEVQRPCHVATHGLQARSGQIFLAPGDYHLRLEREGREVHLVLNQDPPDNFHRPSVNSLFASAAQAYGAKLLALVLTGMGDDGKRGCEEVVRQGGTVWVQDESSSVVWGMPGAVARSGLATRVLPISELATCLRSLSGGAI